MKAIFNFDDGKEVKLPDAPVPPIRKTCESCWQDFNTHMRWARRCPECKSLDKPYTKRVYGDKNVLPF